MTPKIDLPPQVNLIYLLLKNRQAEAHHTMGHLMTLPHNSPEVEAEVLENLDSAGN